MIRVTSTMIKCSFRCFCSCNRGRLVSHYQKRNWSKIKKKYINFRNHRNSALSIVADTSSPVITEMDGKPISGRGYRPCFSRFLLNAQCPNEIEQWVTLLKSRSHAHMDYGKRVFFKDKHNLKSYLTLS